MGGVSIEEHWDQLSSIKVDAAVDVSQWLRRNAFCVVCMITG